MPARFDLRGTLLRQGLAAGLAAAATALTAALARPLGAPYFFAAFPAVMAAALAGGTCAGIVCAVLYGLGVDWLLVEPGTLRLADPRTAARLASAGGAMILVAAISGRLRGALLRERRSRAEAEREVAMRAAAEERLRRAHARLAGLQELTAALSSAVTPAEVAAATFAIGLPLVGARWGAICLRAPEGALSLSHHAGLAADEAGELAELPLETAHPAAEAARGGHPVWLASDAEVAGRTPRRIAARTAPAERDGARAWLPLTGHGATVGVLGLGFARERPFDLVERTFAETVALHCAEALARARLHESERTARARAEQAELASRRAATLQEQVLSVVGHDLRTPLSAVIMGVGLLRRQAGADAPAVDRIARSAARIDEIVRDLLDLARARQGLGMVLTPGPVALDDVCAQAIAELEQARPGRRVRLRSAGDVRCDGDRSRVQQAISNLIANALQHGPAGEEVEVEVQGRPGHVSVRVHNGGAPIPPEVLPEIFEPFRRGPEAGAGAGSVGLGLFIVREIARAHAGDVAVTSAEGQGTTLELRLPRRPNLALPREGAPPPPRDPITSFLH